MKIKPIFKAMMLAAALSSPGLFYSCTEKNPEGDGAVTYGSIRGTVRDNGDNLLKEVSVNVKDIEGTILTNETGEFVFENVPVKSQLVTFSKEGYTTVGITVQASSFKDGTATVSPVLYLQNASVTGIVYDIRNGKVPFEGVTVKAGNLSAVTDGEGRYTIKNMTAGDYTVEFSANGVKSTTVDITEDMFKGDALVTAELEPVYLGGKELLGDLTVQELRYADKWFYNEYRGGKGNGGGVVDWSTVFMSTLKFVGQWENQNEGCTLQIRNGESDQGNPADLENFDSFVYGSKKITEDNKIMTLYCRTHNAETRPVRWGVRVIDITDATNPESKLVYKEEDFKSTSNENKDIDLSAYIGKEVIIAVGIFRAETGDYYNQFVIRKMSFAPQETKADEYLPGTAVSGLDGWHMTNENVRSIMPNTLTGFSGIPSIAADGKDGKGYNPWNGTNHIAAQWAFMYVNKDVEPTASEGFVIKVRSDALASLSTPESYFYAKFSIDDSHDYMTFRTRNGDDGKYTYFKITAIGEDGTVKHLSPVKHKAIKAEAASDGAWKFINNAGDAGNSDAYASFEYDLSEFKGQDIVLAIGVFKGETTDGEQKLFLHSVNFN